MYVCMYIYTDSRAIYYFFFFSIFSRPMIISTIFVRLQGTWSHDFSFYLISFTYLSLRFPYKCTCPCRACFVRMKNTKIDEMEKIIADVNAGPKKRKRRNVYMCVYMPMCVNFWCLFFFVYIHLMVMAIYHCRYTSRS